MAGPSEVEQLQGYVVRAASLSCKIDEFAASFHGRFCGDHIAQFARAYSSPQAVRTQDEDVPSFQRNRVLRNVRH